MAAAGRRKVAVGIAVLILVAAAAAGIAAFKKRGPQLMPTPFAELEATVAAIRGDLTVLSVGARDGVESGARFQIFRGDRYLAEVMVLRATDDMIGAKIQHQVAGAQIAVGDRARLLKPNR